MALSSTEAVRPPAVAGMFYPGQPETLRRDVDRMLAEAPAFPDAAKIAALIVPHAGYAYSGFTAAHAFRAVQGLQFDTVIAVGPSHREYFDYVSVYDGRAYATPLGIVEIDAEVRNALVQEGLVSSNAGHRAEHSVEVQVPFLQRALASFRFVPLIMGTQHPRVCEALGTALANASQGRRVLLVASSDLSHFHPAEEAAALDHRVVGEVERFHPEELMQGLADDRLEACGGGPIVAVMEAARRLGAAESRILHYCHSGDVTGDRDSVVGYVSAAILRSR